VFCIRSIILRRHLTTFKGSKLKPDAPEFVPNQSKTNSTDSPTKSNGKDAAKVQKKKEREERKAASLAKKAGKKVAKQLDAPDGMFLAFVDTISCSLYI
jgi:hypothetical protein